MIPIPDKTCWNMDVIRGLKSMPVDVNRLGYKFGDEGKRYSRVTTVLSQKSKPNLYGWYARMAAESAQSQLLGKFGPMEEAVALTRGEVASVCAKAAEAANTHRDAAADKGTRAHAIVESIIQGQTFAPQNEDEAYLIKEFTNWYANCPFTFVATEVPVFHRRLGYAGRVDAIGVLRSNPFHPVIGDFKSGGLYVEAFIQMCPYEAALADLGAYSGIRVAPGDDPAPVLAGIHIPRDQKTSLSVKVIHDSKEFVKLRNAFMGCIYLREADKCKPLPVSMIPSLNGEKKKSASVVSPSLSTSQESHGGMPAQA